MGENDAENLRERTRDRQDVQLRCPERNVVLFHVGHGQILGNETNSVRFGVSPFAMDSGSKSSADSGHIESGRCYPSNIVVPEGWYNLLGKVLLESLVQGLHCEMPTQWP